MISPDAAIFAFDLIMPLEHLNPHLNIDWVEPVIELAMQMDLRDDYLRVLFFSTTVSSMSLIFADFVWLTTLVETAAYTVDELETAYLLSLSKNLAQEL